MKRLEQILNLALLATLSASPCLAAGTATIKAVNNLQLERKNETIELSAKDLKGLGSPATIHVSAGGKDLLCQAVDTDGDYDADSLIFQADFAPGETKTFTATTGPKWEYKKDDFKAYGRFNQERFDDFMWENDRVAHRMYGKALETWKKEPLTSSAIDVWVKNTPKLVMNDWYMIDNYHQSQGEGADFYDCGATRGDGGNGLWTGDSLAVSKNFVGSRILANGPIRVMFELTYDPFDVAGNKVGEVKRVALDAGQNFDRIWSIYNPAQPGELTTGIGIKQKNVSDKAENAEHGWFATWESLPKDKKDNSHLGLAILTNPKLLVKSVTDKDNFLLLAKVPEKNVAEYWIGSAWEKGGQYDSFDAWKKGVDEFAQMKMSPIEVTVAAQ